MAERRERLSWRQRTYMRNSIHELYTADLWAWKFEYDTNITSQRFFQQVVRAVLNSGTIERNGGMEVHNERLASLGRLGRRVGWWMDSANHWFVIFRNLVGLHVSVEKMRDCIMIQMSKDKQVLIANKLMRDGTRRGGTPPLEMRN